MSSESSGKTTHILISLIGPVVALLIAIIGGVHYLGRLDEKINNPNTKKIEEAEKNALEKIEKAKKGVLDPLPPGTIIASVLKPELFLTNDREGKWHLADASSIPQNCEYKNIIENMRDDNMSIADPTDRLPDLRGVFLCGLNAGRDDGKQDPEGDTRLAGTYQSAATGAPNKPLTGFADSSGAHEHDFNAARDHDSDVGNKEHTMAKSRNDTLQTSMAGQHPHQVKIDAGGDTETRPANVSVYFYIKIN